MKRTMQFLTVTVLLLMAVSLFAGEWSAEQKEVWKNVQTYNDLIVNGDVEGFLSYFHEDFSGWHYGSKIPQGLEARAKYIRHFAPQSKTLFSNLTPLSVKVYGDMAIVHYFYADLSKRGDEKEKMESGRWTDILKKQGAKWMLIADHGGPDSSK